MANQKICDFCPSVIKNKIFYLSLTESVVPKNDDKLYKFVTAEEACEMYKDHQEKIINQTRYFEICEECKNVLDYLLKIRLKDLKILKKEVEKTFQISFKEEENIDE